MSSTSGAGGTHANNATKMATGEGKTETETEDLSSGAIITEEDIDNDGLLDASRSSQKHDHSQLNFRIREGGVVDTLSAEPGSPAGSGSIADDTPSVQVRPGLSNMTVERTTKQLRDLFDHPNLVTVLLSLSHQ